MLCRVVLIAIAISSGFLLPSLVGGGRVAAASLCDSATGNPLVTVLPFTPTSSLPAGGSFCFTFQGTNAGPMLKYEARVTGVHAAGTLSLVASWSPIDRKLHLQGTVALADVGEFAVAGCGCITPALRLPPPPHGQYVGTQAISFPAPPNGIVDVSGSVILQPHD